MTPIDDDQDATRALVRDVGRRSVAQLGEGVTRMIGETSALSRWLLTMLVLINGAGLWYCLGAEAGRFGAAPLLFFAGALVAIVAAIAGLVMALQAAGAMRAAIAVWTDVASSGALTDEALAAARRVRRMGLVWMSVIALFSLGALGLFLAGAWTAWGRTAVAEEIAPPAEAMPEAAPANAAAPPPVNAAEVAPTPSPSPSPSAAQPRPSPSPTARPRRPTPKPEARRAPAASPSPAATPSPRPAPSSPPPALPPVLLPATPSPAPSAPPVG